MAKKYTEEQIRKIVKKAIEETKKDMKQTTEVFGEDLEAKLLELRDLAFMGIFACNFNDAMREAKKHENNS